MGIWVGGSLGHMDDGSVPKIIGQTTKFWRWGAGSSGVFVDTPPEEHYVVSGTGNATFVGLTFDASRSSTAYSRDDNYVIPRRLNVYYTIKY